MAKMPPLPPISKDPEHKRTFWETIILTTPVVLTVVATVLAGLSSSELSGAQYSRSLAAQMQSKASDQWGYFQAKKLRADDCDNTVQILQNLSQPVPFDPASVRAAADRLVDQMSQLSAGQTAEHVDRIKALVAQLDEAATRPDTSSTFFGAVMPTVQDEPIDNPQIVDAIRAVDSRVSESELESQAGKIPQEDLDQAISVANDNVNAFSDAVDRSTKSNASLTQLWRQIAAEITAFEAAVPPEISVAGLHDLAARLNAAFSVAELRWNSTRYAQEARYNQVLGQLYEIQVRKDGFTSERHRQRSKEFFYGMLGAQAGVTIATFSLAVQRRSLLWGLAASAGLAAVTFAAYVYVFV